MEKALGWPLPRGQIPGTIARRDSITTAFTTVRRLGSTRRNGLPSTMNAPSLGAYLLAAIALLGSPGPGIASLIAVGRVSGLVGGLRYLAGLQVGLALAAGVTAMGVLSLLEAVPGLLTTMQIAATLYLVLLAWQIATSPIGTSPTSHQANGFFRGGLFLGLTNPKSLIAFASLFASQAIVAGNPRADSLLKWMLAVLVMVVVDLLWLLFGVYLHRTDLSPRSERSLNIILALSIVVAVVLGLDFSALRP